MRDRGFVDLVFEIKEGNILQISQIDFVGNKSFSDRQLRNAIKSKRAGLFSSFSPVITIPRIAKKQISSC